MTMTDETKGGASGGTADQLGSALQDAPGAASGGATDTEAKPLTQSEVKALIEANNQQLLGQAEARSRSLVDAADNRITARYRSELAKVGEVVEAYKAAGQEIPAAVLATLQDRALRNAVEGGKKAEGKAGDDGQGQGQEDAGDAQEGGAASVVQRAIAMQDLAGVYLLDADPETAQIYKGPDATLFLASVREQIEAKRVRLQGASDEDSEEEEPEEKPGPGKGLQARAKGKRTTTLKDGVSPTDRLDAGIREAVTGAR